MLYPNVKLVNHVETLGAPASSYAAIRKRVQGEDGLPKTYPPQQPFQPCNQVRVCEAMIVFL